MHPEPVAVNRSGTKPGPGQREVPRIGRVLDLVGILLFLAGAGLYAWAWSGLKALREFERAPGDTVFAAVARANELSAISRGGFALMAAGVVVAVLAAVVARRVR
ncbi:MAG: hypothetical protein ACRELV_07115 [Longimicrobiales bacterium]